MLTLRANDDAAAYKVVQELMVVKEDEMETRGTIKGVVRSSLKIFLLPPQKSHVH